MPDAAVADPPVTPVVETPVATPQEPQTTRSHYESRRDAMVADADKNNLSADQFDALISKANEGAKASLVRLGVETAETPKDPAKPEAKAPAAPSEIEKLKAELDSTKDATQKRIDELTAKLHAATAATEASRTPSKPAEPTLQTIPVAELEALWDKAEVRGFKAKDSNGDEMEDPALNARIKRQVETEMRRREREAEVKPLQEQEALRVAQDASFAEVMKVHQKHFFKPTEKDGKQVLAFDPELPASKLARQKIEDWKKNRPELALLPDAPMRAAKEAIAELGSGIDAEAAREIAKLRTENESLRTRLNMDGGSPGGGTPTPRPQDALGDNYAENRRKEYLRRTGR